MAAEILDTRTFAGSGILTYGDDEEIGWDRNGGSGKCVRGGE